MLIHYAFIALTFMNCNSLIAMLPSCQGCNSPFFGIYGAVITNPTSTPHEILNTFTSRISDFEGTNNRDDTSYAVGMNTFLFKRLVIEAAQNSQLSPNPLRELLAKVRTNTIATNNNTVQITQKDITHRLLPYLDWNGCIMDNNPRIYTIKTEREKLGLIFSPCVHEPVILGAMLSSSNDRFYADVSFREVNPQENTEQFNKLLHDHAAH